LVASEFAKHSGQSIKIVSSSKKLKQLKGKDLTASMVPLVFPIRLIKLINLQVFKDLDDLENCAKRRLSRLIHCCFFFTLPFYQQLNQKGTATFRGRLARVRNKNNLKC
jgi:hypothetical protein